MMVTYASASLQLLLLACVVATTANAHTAVLFGASGAVGSEVLRALLRHPFWEEVILVGRRWPAFDNNAETVVTKVELPDLGAVDRNERLREMRVDACFIAVGVGSPHHGNLHYWHSVEVEMTAAMVRLCEGMQARYIALLSAIDSKDDPEPFLEEELNDHDGPLGWWGMLVGYARMKGLAERAVASAGISFVRLFQPSNIVTETIRYGWLDWILFKLLPFLDPLLPERYHSVPARLLGMAMAGDAVEVLRDDVPASGVTRLAYGDFVRIAGEEFQEQEEGAKLDGGRSQEQSEKEL